MAIKRKYHTEEDLKEVLAVSFSTTKSTVIGPRDINRYWVNEVGQRFEAYIETDAFPGEPAVRYWLLGHCELAEYRAVWEVLRSSHVVPYGADSRLVDEYRSAMYDRLDKEFKQLERTGKVTRAVSALRFKPYIETQLPKDKPIMPPPSARSPALPGKHIVSPQVLPTPANVELPEVAFKCSCNDAYFCQTVRSFIRTRGGVEMLWNTIQHNAGLGWMKVALPFFGNILHRVACTIGTVSDWEGNDYRELTVCLQTFRPDPVTQYFTKQEVIEYGVDPLGWVFDMIENDMLTEPAAKQQIDVVSAFLDLTAGGNHGCTAPIHNYGTTKMLRNFLNRNQPDPLNEVFAQVMTTMYYNQCVPCYRASELALALIDID